MLATLDMKISSCTFKNNKAQFGAAGRITGDQPTITGTIYSGNTASLGENGDLVTTCIYGEGIGTDGKCTLCPTN